MANSSSGGIVRTGNPVPGRDTTAFRRHWPSGVAVITVAFDAGFRGATVAALAPLSDQPPMVMFALREDSEFHTLLELHTTIGISILDETATFLSERFAGRAPVPDPKFTGVAHELINGVPLLTQTTCTATASIATKVLSGDHLLFTANLDNVRFASDSDAPLLYLDGQYRELDAR